jgi:hypothetical protein
MFLSHVLMTLMTLLVAVQHVHAQPVVGMTTTTTTIKDTTQAGGGDDDGDGGGGETSSYTTLTTTTTKAADGCGSKDGDVPLTLAVYKKGDFAS